MTRRPASVPTLLVVRLVSPVEIPPRCGACGCNAEWFASNDIDGMWFIAWEHEHRCPERRDEEAS